jgi:hypothetical protein
MNPVFVVGAPRSGTSMLHWALAQHPRLWGSAESDFICTLGEAANRAFDDGTRFGEYHWLLKEEVSRDEFLSFMGSGLDALYRSRSGGLRWIEQTPHYIFHYATLRAMFPGARFIHIIRDGRHVVTSMQETFGWSFSHSMAIWKSSMEAGSEINARDPEDFLQIRYESIVTRPEEALRRLFDFIGEEFHDSCVEFLRVPINTAPGREQETPTDKLDPQRLQWGAGKSLRFRLVCGAMQKALGYPLPGP